MIRPVTPDDAATLVRMTAETNVFKPLEIEALEGVLQDYFATEQTTGHRALLWEDEQGIVGYVYYAPEEMTEQTWCLWWIVVDARTQGRGVGAKLLKWVEEDVARSHGRILYIETSSLPHYEATCRFYVKNGYEWQGRLRDFYADGDDMMVYSKHLLRGASPTTS